MRRRLVPGLFLVRAMGAAYSLDMEEPTEGRPGKAMDTDNGEVPEKQLQRWKGEGGALPPEPDSGTEDDLEFGSQPDADDV